MNPLILPSYLQAADLAAVSAQAAAQVERARRAAKASVKAVLSTKPKFKLHLALDAPKVAVLVPVTAGSLDGVLIGCTSPIESPM